ncbi:MAG: succinylglutamate desuccinylase/aspartoacylase family protein, partial [Bdellovibrionales bacterium]|nr:succinylglutamate desuccinylase/aspartoacylase family protein [Bdellovibrionales bacterium]
ESQRAKELSDEVFKWASGEPFFLIDLHTTTANMGVTLVLSKMDRLSARVIKRICDQDPSYHVLLNSDRDDECIFVDSMAPHGLLIEIGPVPQNVYDPRVITLMEKVVVETLEALLEEEASLPTPGPIEVELFQEGPAVKFPGAINGQLTTIVHPDLVGRDYEPLKQGMSVFVDTQGQCVHWQGEDVYPVFINEAAYLTQETAFITTTKANIKF